MIRPTTTCAWCHRECRSSRRVCEQCVGIASYRTTDHNENHALTDGEWRPVNGILRWFPNGPQPVEPDPFDEAADTIACPTCRAGVTETCRTKNGHRTTDHPARTIPRKCRCGNDLKPRCQYCADCKAEVRREQKIRYDRRQAERRDRAAA